MSDFKNGDPVTVRIGGHDMEGTFLHFQHGYVGIEIDGLPVLLAPDRIKPVTPPCPWTEPGTIVEYGSRRAVLDDEGLWYRVVLDGEDINYFTDIAPFNPVRLIPEDAVSTMAIEFLRSWGSRSDAAYREAAYRAAEKIERGELS